MILFNTLRTFDTFRPLDTILTETISVQEWKVVNLYQVRCRKQNAITGKTNKMSLQLYQVDYKSYLLDFKSLSCDPGQSGTSSWSGDGPSGQEQSRSGSVSRDSVTSSIPTNNDPFTNPLRESQTYYVMQFFEMCAALITQLAK